MSEMKPIPFLSVVVIVLCLVILGQQLFFYLNNPASRPLAVLTPGSVTGESYAPTTWKIWSDTDYLAATGVYTHYTVQYPRDFDVYQGDIAAGGLIGTPRVKLAFPRDAFQVPKSNLGEAYVTISVGKDANSVKNCYVNPNPNNAAGGFGQTATINGIVFREATTTDVGAGNIYASEVYRTIFNKYCYEAILTIHTGNIQNYPSGAVVEFDQTKALPILRQILGTFKFSTSTEPSY